MPLLTLRTVTQQSFTIEVEESMTVGALKEKVAAEKGADSYPVGGQKIIYAGKVLNDDTTLAEHKIDFSKFAVIMVSGAKPKPTESSGSSVPVPAAAGNPAPAAAAAPAAPAAADPAAPPPPAAFGLAGPDFDNAVQNIMAMGYERPQVEMALRAAFGNADRAVEYLLMGMPGVGEVGGVGGGGGVAGEAPSAESPAEGSEEGGEGGGSGPLDFLRENPQFEQMRQMVRANPQLLQTVIQQLGATNPQLLQAIQQNQEEFIRLLNSDGDEEAAPGGGGGGGAGGGGGGIAIPVSAEDRAAIERLTQLGFSEAAAIQAYLAFDKNEEQAANFLFEDMEANP